MGKAWFGTEIQFEESCMPELRRTWFEGPRRGFRVLSGMHREALEWTWRAAKLVWSKVPVRKTTGTGSNGAIPRRFGRGRRDGASRGRAEPGGGRRNVKRGALKGEGRLRSLPGHEVSDEGGAFAEHFLDTWTECSCFMLETSGRGRENTQTYRGISYGLLPTSELNSTAACFGILIANSKARDHVQH